MAEVEKPRRVIAHSDRQRPSILNSVIESVADEAL